MIREIRSAAAENAPMRIIAGALLLALAMSARTPQDSFDEFQKLRRDLRAAPAGEARAALARSIESLLPRVVGPLLIDLKTGTPEKVSRAASLLARIGNPAAPDLEALAKSGTAEESARAAGVLRLIRRFEAGDDGTWKQWAVDAKASSEFNGQGKTDPSDWSARQACGKPDTDEAGDHPTAWASHEPDGGEEWLELTYRVAVRPERIRIHETFNPGAVSRIEAQDPDKKWRELWNGKDPTSESPGVFDLALPAPEFATRRLRITVDSEAVKGWNEIDAVQLIGEPGDEPVSVADASDRTDPSKGSIKTVRFDSKSIGAKRTVKVWLPPGHDPARSYPVFYCCDGMLNVNMKLVEPLISDGRIPPVIVVAILHGPNLRMQEYVQTGSKAFADHERWFVEEVLPWAEKEFGASRKREERIVFGSSNGGPFSLTMGARHPDLFGNVVGAMVYALNLARWKKDLPEQPKESQRYFLYAGNQDANGVRENALAEAVLKERGYSVTNTVVDGEGHTNRFNQIMLPKILEELFGRKKPREY
jgi:enterochelin esterase-like enzyme